MIRRYCIKWKCIRCWVQSYYIFQKFFSRLILLCCINVSFISVLYVYCMKLHVNIAVICEYLGHISWEKQQCVEYCDCWYRINCRNPWSCIWGSCSRRRPMTPSALTSFFVWPPPTTLCLLPRSLGRRSSPSPGSKHYWKKNWCLLTSPFLLFLIDLLDFQGDLGATSKKVVVLGGTYHKRGMFFQCPTTTMVKKTRLFVFASVPSRSLQNVLKHTKYT